jgi:hypothetical protein
MGKVMSLCRGQAVRYLECPKICFFDRLKVLKQVSIMIILC